MTEAVAMVKNVFINNYNIFSLSLSHTVLGSTTDNYRRPSKVTKW